MASAHLLSRIFYPIAQNQDIFLEEEQETLILYLWGNTDTRVGWLWEGGGRSHPMGGTNPVEEVSVLEGSRSPIQPTY